MSIRALASLFLLVWVPVGYVPADVVNWGGSDNQPWSVQGYWAGGALPAATDTACIASGCAWADLDLGVSSVLVEAGGRLNIGTNIPSYCTVTLGGGRLVMYPPAAGAIVAGKILLTADSIIQRDDTSQPFTFTGTITQQTVRRKLTFLSVPDTRKGAFVGAVTLTNKNVYNGGSEIIGPTVRVSHAFALGTGAVLVAGGRLALNVNGGYGFDLVTMVDGAILLEKSPIGVIMDLQGGTLQHNGTAVTFDSSNGITIYNTVTIQAGGTDPGAPFRMAAGIGGPGRAVLNPFSEPTWDPGTGGWIYTTRGRLVLAAVQAWSGGTDIRGLVDLDCSNALPGGTVTVHGQDPACLPASAPGVLRVFNAYAFAANTDLVLERTHYSYEDPVTHIVTEADWYGSIYLQVSATVRSLKAGGVYVPAGTYAATDLPNYLKGTGKLTVTTTMAVAGDVNGDGHVDVVDLLYLVDAFGSVEGEANYDPACDFNSDGGVDVVDLLVMVENWGV
jgi:hypothetical protein